MIGKITKNVILLKENQDLSLPEFVFSKPIIDLKY